MQKGHIVTSIILQEKTSNLFVLFSKKVFWVTSSNYVLSNQFNRQLRDLHYSMILTKIIWPTEWVLLLDIVFLKIKFFTVLSSNYVYYRPILYLMAHFTRPRIYFSSKIGFQNLPKWAFLLSTATFISFYTDMDYLLMSTANDENKVIGNRDEGAGNVEMRIGEKINLRSISCWTFSPFDSVRIF